MISFDEALQRVVAAAPRLPAERSVLRHAAQRVLAVDLRSRLSLPRFDYSERDGYAVDSGGLAGRAPFRLRVHQEILAGQPGVALPAGMAARIMTGAELPLGADAVVMQEDAVCQGDWIALAQRPTAGAYRRRRGEDLEAGALALAAGTRLSAGAIALAAMLGEGEVSVARRPRVVIIPTGDELALAGAELAPGQIFEANAAALEALAAQAGASVAAAAPVRDVATSIGEALEAGLEAADLLVTIGGVSVGERDLVRPALERAGVELEFWRVAIKPGKPLAFGRRGRTLTLALPGNPASALVTFALFGVPLLRALQGDSRPCPVWLPAAAGERVERTPEREQFLRARFVPDGARLLVQAHPQQASGAATSLALSEGLARVPRGSGPLPPDASIGVVRWSDL